MAVVCGPRYPESNGGLLLLLLSAIQVSLVAVLWIPTFLLSQRLSPGQRCSVVVVLTALYLGFWLGWTFLLYAAMARDESWL
jgi:hypothetical protein